ncbi:unnamed protein product [Owenia fusiformis]|uniref:Uncharacterized protein n=1 Tax=Owenia fusiformis TaxID=6347 RepID=A0A8J1UA20_OWEFU|nr:unnamed protein product [Owenia fusiformis]
MMSFSMSIGCLMLILALSLKKSYGLSQENIKEIEEKHPTITLTKHDGNFTITTKGDVSADLKSISLTIPLDTTVASSPGCLSGGDRHTSIIGITIKGVPIMSPFTEDGCDIATLVSDENLCNHKYDNVGANHHSLFCDYSDSRETDLVGIAMDGHPIHGPIADRSSLDECNGKMKANGEYGYYLSKTFPYVLGCFRGTTDGSIIEMNKESESIEEPSASGGPRTGKVGPAIQPHQHLRSIGSPMDMKSTTSSPKTTPKPFVGGSNKQSFLRGMGRSLHRGIVQPPSMVSTTLTPTTTTSDQAKTNTGAPDVDSKMSTTPPVEDGNKTETAPKSTTPSQIEASKKRKKRAETRIAQDRMATPADDLDEELVTSEKPIHSSTTGTSGQGKCFYARNMDMKDKCVVEEVSDLGKQSNHGHKAEVQGLVVMGNVLFAMIAYVII